MNFASDNTTAAAPEIMAALNAANDGQTMPYGNDAATDALNATFGELFETEVSVFPVGTGTACNALALSVLTPPFGAVFCYAGSHIADSECGAPEFYTGGAKMVRIDAEHGTLTPDALSRAIAAAGGKDVHQMPPAALSLTQQTECGTHYAVDEVAALSEIAREHGLNVHMDGARFANAVATLGCSPAATTWRAGVDVLSFGATKNGAWAAEAVVVFKPELARELAHRRMRAGHLFSKMRFIAVQLDAMIADGLWLANAAHANRLAGLLAAGLAPLPGIRLLHPVAGNMIFAEFPGPLIEALDAAGFAFYREPSEAGATVRLVAAFNTREADVEAFIATARRHTHA